VTKKFEKNRQKIAIWALKDHWSAAVRGGGAPGAPPLDPLVDIDLVRIENLSKITNHFTAKI